MAVGQFVAGKIGYVMIDDRTEWAFSKWSYKPSAVILPRNTFIANGKKTNITGFVGADLTLEGPFDEDQPAPLEVGISYLFYLGIDPDEVNMEFSVTARIESIDIRNDAEDGPMWTVSAQSTGDFDAITPQTGE